MRSVPTTAAIAVARNTPPRGMPAWERMFGLTARMYAIVMNVVTPATISVRTVVRLRLRRKRRPRNPRSGSAATTSRSSQSRRSSSRSDSASVMTPSARTSSSSATKSAISALSFASGRAKSSRTCVSSRSTFRSPITLARSEAMAFLSCSSFIFMRHTLPCGYSVPKMRSPASPRPGTM